MTMQMEMPRSIEAEQAVLGGLLIDNRSFEKISEILKPEYFYYAAHQILFRVLRDLSLLNLPYDALLVTEKLKTINKLSEIGSETFLFELVNACPSSANIVLYASIVRNKAILRKVYLSIQDIYQKVKEGGETDAAVLLSQAERIIFETGAEFERSAAPRLISELICQSMDRIDKLSLSESLSGIATGYRKLDHLTQGFQKGDLIILAARPSMGKTSLAMNIAENVSLSGKGVIFFSMEMSGLSIAERLLSSSGLIFHNRIKSGMLNESEYVRISESVKKFSGVNLFIDESSGLTYTEVLSRSRRISRQCDLGLIVVDYLQLMTTASKTYNRNAEISEISRGLKMVAKELNVPVLALSQLNRGVENRQEKRPTLSDLRDSGCIEQDADLIMFIYRDEIYKKDSAENGLAEIIVSKHRNGELDSFYLIFSGKYTRFENPITFY